MMDCRVCGAHLARPDFEADAPALTSMMAPVDAATRVYVCEGCGHAQCDDFGDVAAYYDKTYRISLDSEDHDQIIGTNDKGEPLFRTDHQADLSLRLFNLKQGARVLDYGCGKSDTLRKICRARPDIRPSVFDVSDDYRGAWAAFVPAEEQASYAVPEHWQGRFDAVMAHFVIEHVERPVEFLTTLKSLLAPGGEILVSLPDVSGNPGDMIVVDHLNHFSLASLKGALARAGLAVSTIDTTSYPGGFLAVARLATDDEVLAVDPAEIAAAVSRNREICAFWEAATQSIDRSAEARKGRRAAIYGSGFYGSWLVSRIGGSVDVACFLDQNPNLQGRKHYDRPVHAPQGFDDGIDLLFVGLNPLRARAIIGSQPVFSRPGLDIVWIDGKAA